MDYNKTLRSTYENDKKITAVVIALVMGASALVLDGTEIMGKVFDYRKPDFSKPAMVIILSKNGKVEETRQVCEYGRCKNNLFDIDMVFYKDTPFLVKENESKDDGKWVCLPLLMSTSRVFASNGSNAFVGTDFSYDDMNSLKVEEYTHELPKESEEKRSLKDMYVVKSTQKGNKSSQYSTDSHTSQKTSSDLHRALRQKWQDCSK